MRRSWLRERRWRGQRERPPVAAVAPPLPRRPLSKEERHEIMRDDILARMRPDKNNGETAARLCPLHTWKLATRSPQLADSSWAIRYSSQGWTCARSGECWLLLMLLLLLLLLAVAAVAGRRSAWATAVPMLAQQRTYTRSSCSNSQETKTRKQLMAHAELCCDS